MTFDAIETLRHIFVSGRQIIKPATYQFSFKSDDSPAQQSFCVTANRDDVHVEEKYSPGFDIHIVFSPEDFSRCIEAECKLSDLYSARRVHLEGDVALGASLLQAFQLWQEVEQRQPGEADESSPEYLFRQPMGASSIDPEVIAASAVLQKWVNPYYLKPHVIAAKRAAVQAMPLARYATLDDFFRTEVFDELIEHHRRLDFVPDDVGLNFDSSVVYAEEGKHFGADLFFSPDWHRYISYIVGADLQSPGQALVRLRRHDPFAHGFWPHSDRVHDTRGRRAAFALAYFNKGWSLGDGGIFQLWRALQPQGETAEHAPLHQWSDYCGQRLSFLETGTELDVEVPVGSLGFRKKRLLLVDQILPEYNRVMICDLTSDPVLHSVSPSRGRLREGFVQWVY